MIVFGLDEERETPSVIEQSGVLGGSALVFDCLVLGAWCLVLGAWCL